MTDISLEPPVPMPPPIPLEQIAKRKIVRRVRHRQERLHNEKIAEQLQAHHEAYIEQLKADHLKMLAERVKPIVYEVERNDTGTLIELPGYNGKAVIVQDYYYVRHTDPVTGLERVFGMSPEELEMTYEDADENPPS